MRTKGSLLGEEGLVLAGQEGLAEGALTESAGPVAQFARRRRRSALWSALAAGALSAALIGVIASSRPASEVVARSLLVGRQAPPISGTGLDGGHYSLAELRGKWVVVNFMATWCVPCQQEMPQLVEFARQHSARSRATVLTVAYDPANISQLHAFLVSHHADWPAVDDPGASVSYGLSGLPSSFLVAPDGTVYAYVQGKVTASELDGWISQATARGLGGA
ncbi:MAG: TlpA family protein disulfide reductase [Acidimicrobiales bacterium]